MDTTDRPHNRRRGRPPGSKSKTSSSSQSQSLSRGLGLLERLSQTERGVTLTDISLQVGLPPATAHRLLNTLEQQGFVEQDDEQGLWFIGLKSFQIGSAFLNHRDFIVTARPYMRQLMEQSGETVNLAILHDGQAVFVSQIECREMMRMVVPLGSTAPVHASGAGKALLAALPEYEVTKILHKRGLDHYTDTTLDTPAKLRTALDDIQQRGYAIDDEEHALGLLCVAATIHDQFSEPVAAISVSGPKVRLTAPRIPELGAMVARAAVDITASLGGQIPTNLGLHNTI